MFPVFRLTLPRHRPLAPDMTLLIVLVLVLVLALFLPPFRAVIEVYMKLCDTMVMSNKSVPPEPKR